MSRNNKGEQGINKKKIIHTIICYSLVIIFALALNTFVISGVKVEGKSMLTTLKNSDRLILEKVTYYHKNPSRYDIIVFKPTQYPKKYFIKRVIGLPGETVQIKDGFVYIDDKKIKEDYLKMTTVDPGLAAQPITLGKDEYFVLGDNRDISRDSRKADVGLVKKEQILGKVLCRFWPLSKMGSIE